MLNNFGGGTPVSLLDAAAYTAATNGTGKDLKGYCNEALVILSASAASSGDSLVVTLETCATVNGTYAAITDSNGSNFAFGAVNTGSPTVQAKILNLSKNLGFIRAVATPSGDGSPSFTVACVVYCMPKVRT